MANFIENWRNSLANWLEREQNKVSHLSDISGEQRQRNIPGSPLGPDGRGAAIRKLRRGGVLDPNIKNPYLGNSRGDFNSPEYFSNNTYAEAPYSESFVIKGANQDGKGPWQNTYDLDVRYDEDGAIYGVYLRDASGRERGMSALGADELSDFFKNLGLDTNSYVVKKQGAPKEVKVGQGSDIYRPTDIFGIDGIFSR